MDNAVVVTILGIACLSVGFVVTRALQYSRIDAVFATVGATAIALTWWLAGTWHPTKSPVFILIGLAQLSTTILLIGTLGHNRNSPTRTWWLGRLAPKLPKQRGHETTSRTGA